MSRLLTLCKLAGVPKPKRRFPNQRKKVNQAWKNYRRAALPEDSLTIVKREVPVHTFGGLHYRNPKKPILCLF